MARYTVKGKREMKKLEDLMTDIDGYKPSVFEGEEKGFYVLLNNNWSQERMNEELASRGYVVKING